MIEIAAAITAQAAPSATSLLQGETSYKYWRGLGRAKDCPERRPHMSALMELLLFTRTDGNARDRYFPEGLGANASTVNAPDKLTHRKPGGK
jgi:hypothetical protein